MGISPKKKSGSSESSWGDYHNEAVVLTGKKGYKIAMHAPPGDLELLYPLRGVHGH